MKFKPLFKDSKTLKSYEYGPFFAVIIKDFENGWEMQIRKDLYRVSDVSGYYAFRATDINVKYYIEKLIYEKSHKMIKMIFEE